MYAIFKHGNKQYQVIEGQTIQIEKINKKIGKKIEFDKILAIIDNNKTTIGHPFVKNQKIQAEIISHKRGKKIKIIKFKRRKHFRKHQGHRQWFTNIKITHINPLESKLQIIGN